MRRNKQVVVLAGGLGSRLAALRPGVPKALRPVGERAFVDVLIDSIARSGLRRFHFCLGHLGEDVVRHLDALAPPLEVTHRVEPTPCGTAGALVASGGQLDDTFLLTMGDTYMELDYAGLFDRLPRWAGCVMVVTRAPSDVAPNVGLDGDRVIAYDKGGVAGGWIDTGVAVMRRHALDLLADDGAQADLTLLLRRLIARRALAAATTDRRFYDVGTPERLRLLERVVAGGGAAAEARPTC
jgi:NDP-sugar pyrophosphorylase family protein